MMAQAVDIEIQAREIMYHKANLNRILAYHCKQPVTKVDEDTDRDRCVREALPRATETPHRLTRDREHHALFSF